MDTWSHKFHTQLEFLWEFLKKSICLWKYVFCWWSCKLMPCFTWKEKCLLILKAKYGFSCFRLRSETSADGTALMRCSRLCCNHQLWRLGQVKYICVLKPQISSWMTCPSSVGWWHSSCFEAWCTHDFGTKNRWVRYTVCLQQCIPWLASWIHGFWNGGNVWCGHSTWMHSSMTNDLLMGRRGGNLSCCGHLPHVFSWK
jgi:hypothetical protein